MEKRKITLKDLDFDELPEDDIFLELNAGVDGIEPQSYTGSCVASCATSGSLVISFSSLASASDPANTYTELGCC